MLLTIDPKFLGHPSRWWFQICFIFQFDEHIFQMGWFNHQIVVKDLFWGNLHENPMMTSLSFCLKGFFPEAIVTRTHE